MIRSKWYSIQLTWNSVFPIIKYVEINFILCIIHYFSLQDTMSHLMHFNRLTLWCKLYLIKDEHFAVVKFTCQIFKRRPKCYLKKNTNKIALSNITLIFILSKLYCIFHFTFLCEGNVIIIVSNNKQSKLFNVWTIERNKIPGKVPSDDSWDQL